MAEHCRGTPIILWGFHVTELALQQEKGQSVYKSSYKLGGVCVCVCACVSVLVLFPLSTCPNSTSPSWWMVKLVLLPGARLWFFLMSSCETKRWCRSSSRSRQGQMACTTPGSSIR